HVTITGKVISGYGYMIVGLALERQRVRVAVTHNRVVVEGHVAQATVVLEDPVGMVARARVAGAVNPRIRDDHRFRLARVAELYRLLKAPEVGVVHGQGPVSTLVDRVLIPLPIRDIRRLSAGRPRPGRHRGWPEGIVREFDAIAIVGYVGILHGIGSEPAANEGNVDHAVAYV